MRLTGQKLLGLTCSMIFFRFLVPNYLISDLFDRKNHIFLNKKLWLQVFYILFSGDDKRRKCGTSTCIWINGVAKALKASGLG